jgi:tetratricopeptide (TPR) repeat protein
LKTAVLAVPVLVLLGCAAPSPAVAPASAAPIPAAPPVAGATPTEAAPVEPPAAPASLAFIENDYPRALAEARARRVPLFVDAWATWCHTCLSMKSYVFPDPALRPFAARFVWLSVDTEKEENASLVTRLGVRVLPTLYVLDSATEKPVLAWPGSLTAVELTQLLPDAELATHPNEAGSEAAMALLRGHQASAASNDEEAIAAYRAALAAAPPGWPRRPQAVDGLVSRLQDDKQLAACVTLGADEAPKLPAGTALADVVRAAIGCAEDLPAKAPERKRVAELAVLGERIATDLSQPILADDRSDLYDYVVNALRDLPGHSPAEAMRVAKSWSAFVDEQAAHAPDAAGRAVFDAHRLLAYIAIGAPERAVPMLQQSERDFPADYNPPARLATAYLKIRHYDDALAAVKRALDRAYGPRKLRLFALEADIYEAKKDHAAARKSLEDAIDFAGKVPLTGGYPHLREALEKRLARLK